MSESQADILASDRRGDAAPTVDGSPQTPTPTQRYGLRRGFAALRERASIQDKLVEKQAM